MAKAESTPEAGSSIESPEAPATYAPSATSKGTKVMHKKCKKTTDLPPAIAAVHRQKAFMNLPCHQCGGNHPASEFTFV